MVNAWSSRHQLVQGQVAVEQKSNEMQRIRADRRKTTDEANASRLVSRRGFFRRRFSDL